MADLLASFTVSSIALSDVFLAMFTAFWIASSLEALVFWP